MLSPSGSLAVPAGHRRLTASSQDAAPMRLGVMAAGAEAGDVDVPPELRCSAAQHDLAPSPAPPSRASDAAGVLQPPAQGSALVPAAAAPSTAPSAPAVSPARAQQAAERPVRLSIPKMISCLCMCIYILIAAHQVMLKLEFTAHGLSLQQSLL